MKKIPFRTSTPPRDLSKPGLRPRRDTNPEMLRAFEEALKRTKRQ